MLKTDSRTVAEEDLPMLNCEWTYDKEDPDCEGFITSCGYFHSIDDLLPEVEIEYCPYCMNKIYVEGCDVDE
jgi:hypothetical protein